MKEIGVLPGLTVLLKKKTSDVICYYFVSSDIQLEHMKEDKLCHFPLFPIEFSKLNDNKKIFSIFTEKMIKNIILHIVFIANNRAFSNDAI